MLPVIIRPPHPQNIATTLPTVRMVVQVSNSVTVLTTALIVRLLKSKVINYILYLLGPLHIMNVRIRIFLKSACRIMKKRCILFDAVAIIVITLNSFKFVGNAVWHFCQDVTYRWGYYWKERYVILLKLWGLADLGHDLLDWILSLVTSHNDTMHSAPAGCEVCS